MNNNLKIYGIWGAVIIGVVFLFVCMVQSYQNSAITMEEQVNESKSAIETAQKRRFDLIRNLADCVKEYDKHEAEIMIGVAQARSNGDMNADGDVMVQIKAVQEKYPELKSNENYKQLMTELAITENSIEKIRNNYNHQVKEYNRNIRKFPNRIFLDWVSYEVQEYSYLEFKNSSEDAPQNLFNH